ncbi:cobalamin biosynthesis protein [Sphingobium sp. CAP-1]|uniref:cobalamin biosynthesis protein n=1 Tax=Sphingobium sp. CAP-1 TaxID=2676077 RepID=UPI0012BB2968|nr:cobalamin biosynthesis protein [Sphingobium sp. CAP-1]QGP80622.1 precorrin methylase [Sphingobium sp. CAP-1]
MIVAGFGCRTSATAASLRAALAEAQHGLPPVTLLAAPQDKLPALEPLAQALNLPSVGIAPDALAAIATPTHSAASLSARHVGSVCEAAALAAAGPGATLIVGRCVSPDRMATCAIAQGPTA